MKLSEKVKSFLHSLTPFVTAIIVVLMVGFCSFIDKNSSQRKAPRLPESGVMDVLNEKNEKIGIILIEDSTPTTLIGAVYLYTPDECPVLLSYNSDTVTITCINGPAQNYTPHVDLNGTYMYVKVTRLDTMRNSKGG